MKEQEELVDVNQIEDSVRELVAKYAFAGILEDKIDLIPYEVIPGIKAKFRCCVYREREIVRQRVRLLEGKHILDEGPVQEESYQVVQVIPSACEGCPITRFSVTSNCQNCLTRNCMKACKFGAISHTRNGAYIDPDVCVKCGKCVDVCPYRAIIDTERPCIRSCPVKAIDMDENDLALIDNDKCINCGACIRGCPFGAISELSMMVDVIKALQGKRPVYAMLAPSIEGQFGEADIGMIKSFVKQLGFAGVFEVALGADIVAYEEAQELVEHYHQGKVTTTSCCPAFMNLIRQHYPEVADCISSTVSPMGATARLVKNLYPDALTVFIGPCVTKKQEAWKEYPEVVDFVLTFKELHSLFVAKPYEAENDQGIMEQATTYGKGFAKSGGVARAALAAITQQGVKEEIKVSLANGVPDCKKALTLLKAGRFTDNFIEGMACAGGCLNGPATITDPLLARKIFEKYLQNGKEDISSVVKEAGLDKIDIHKH